MSKDEMDIIDAVIDLSLGSRRIAEAITANAAPGTDAFGGSISSLTESVMGISNGLSRIAESIEYLAEAIRDKEKT